MWGVRANVQLIVSSVVLMALLGCGSSGSDTQTSSVPGSMSVSSQSSDSTSVSGGSSSIAASQPIAQKPTVMSFANPAGIETVSYTGQTARQLLIVDMFSAMGALTGNPEDDVKADIDFFFNSEVPKDEVESLFSIESQILAPHDADMRLTYGAVSTGKNLAKKIAGADKVEHLLDESLLGWSTGLPNMGATPTQLVNYWIELLDTVATDGEGISVPVPGFDATLNKAFVTADALDLQQLLQKFLSMAVSFSQGTTDYLQTDFASADNLMLQAGKPYSTSEHHWDEAFGYFGAARSYNDLSDAEIASPGYKDADADGIIDIRTELNLGHSVNCAKRDLGTAGSTNPTDFTQEVFDAFLAGRQILREATEAGQLADEDKARLDSYVAVAALTWEKCIAATVIHYINDTTSDINDFKDLGVYKDLENFTNVAKHWSEMKGFALGLQFSVESPFRKDNKIEDLKMILEVMGDKPVKPSDGEQAIAAYLEGLNNARDLLQAAYQFDPEHVATW